MFNFFSDVHCLRNVCLFILLESMLISNTNCYFYNSVKIKMFKLNPPLIYETKLQSVKEKWYNKLYCSKIKSHTKKSKPLSVASRC